MGCLAFSLIRFERDMVIIFFMSFGPRPVRLCDNQIEFTYIFYWCIKNVTPAVINLFFAVWTKWRLKETSVEAYPKENRNVFWDDQWPDSVQMLKVEDIFGNLQTPWIEQNDSDIRNIELLLKSYCFAYLGAWRNSTCSTKSSCR